MTEHEHDPKTTKRWTCEALFHGIPQESVNAIAPTKEEAIAKWEADGYTDIENVEERTPRLGWTALIGNGRWGAGIDLIDAKHQFRRNGGRLSDGYLKVVFDDETDFMGVGQAGMYFFFGNAPTVTEVAPKGGKR